MIICGTGHRPPKLGGYTVDVFEKLVELASDYLKEQTPNPVIISGMALGWDMALATASTKLGVPFIAAIPFVGQESMWPAASQKAYSDLLLHATRIEVISGSHYAAYKMHRRNEWMVNHSDKVVALYDGDPLGGTAGCLHYAESQGKIVDNLWDKWMEMNNEETEHQMD